MKSSTFSFFQEPASNKRNRTMAKIEAKLHKKVVLHMTNYQRHIRPRHPEVTMAILESVLVSPDTVTRKSRNSKEFYYHKNIDGIEYRVILGDSDYRRKAVITAYSVQGEQAEYSRFTSHYSYVHETACAKDEYLRVYDDITAEYAALLACG